jgi:uncharacterized membrane protein
MCWIHVVQNKDWYQALVNTVMNIRVLLNERLGISWKTEQLLDFVKRAMIFGFCCIQGSEFIEKLNSYQFLKKYLLHRVR